MAYCRLVTKEPSVLLVVTNLDWGKLAQLKRPFTIKQERRSLN